MRRIVIFNFSDQGTSRQTENFRNYITEMSGKGSSTLNCDICNTKFGFLTRKVKKMIRHLIHILFDFGIQATYISLCQFLEIMLGVQIVFLLELHQIHGI